MEYIYSIFNKMGLLKIEDKPKFEKPAGYKNINTSQLGK